MFAFAHNDFLPDNLCHVEAMKRLTHAEKYEVGDVDDVVDGTLSDRGEIIFQPFGTLRYLDVADCDS